MDLRYDRCLFETADIKVEQMSLRPDRRTGIVPRRIDDAAERQDRNARRPTQMEGAGGALAPGAGGESVVDEQNGVSSCLADDLEPGVTRGVVRDRS